LLFQQKELNQPDSEYFQKDSKFTPAISWYELENGEADLPGVMFVTQEEKERRLPCSNYS